MNPALLHILLGFLFSFCIGLNQAVPVTDEEKIVGGKEAAPKAYPWEVSLGPIKGVPTDPNQRYRQQPSIKLASHYCGGVVLTKDWVVTAAHCVVDTLTKDIPLPLDEIGVGAGSNDLVQIYNQGRIPASQVIIKPGYHSDSANSMEDIALVKLSRPIDVNRIKPACLSKVDVPPNQLYKDPLTAIGWGNVNPLVLDKLSGQWSGIQAPQRMKQVSMKDASNASQFCQRRPDLICINPTTPKQGPCKGDSGGSLVMKNTVVVGLTSFGGSIKVGDFKIQTCNGDAAYTRISKQIAWIQSIVKDRICIV
ncbi:unnamed protein product [Absidia cylindrospora]